MRQVQAPFATGTPWISAPTRRTAIFCRWPLLHRRQRATPRHQIGGQISRNHLHPARSVVLHYARRVAIPQRCCSRSKLLPAVSRRTPMTQPFDRARRRGRVQRTSSRTSLQSFSSAQQRAPKVATTRSSPTTHKRSTTSKRRASPPWASLLLDAARRRQIFSMSVNGLLTIWASRRRTSRSRLTPSETHPILSLRRSWQGRR